MRSKIEKEILKEDIEYLLGNLVILILPGLPALKLFGIVNWSWWIVLSPVIAIVAFCLVGLIFGLAALLFEDLRDQLLH